MAANTEFQRVGVTGWRTGLANLLHKENRAWWASRLWLVQGLLWTALMNGVVAITMLAEGVTKDSVYMAMASLFQMGTLALPVGAILLIHAETVSERQLGVTEWLLSKPVSRAAYVLSKLFAHGLGVLVILVVLQGAIAYGQVWLAMGEPFPLSPYLVGMAGVTVHTLFYLALTLMMGVLTANRPLLLGVALGVHFGGVLGIGLFGKYLGSFVWMTPWSLFNGLQIAVLGIPLPVSIWVPIGVSAALSIVFVAVTVARFERLQF
jgi:ABC-type transport system involved in multi-copper enzyme maturation permease subunit